MPTLLIQINDAEETDQEIGSLREDMRIARVFPTRTNATPRDDLAFYGPPGLFPPEVDAVHISVAFTWDLARAQWLAEEWQRIAPVHIGGPGIGMRGEDFSPGMYLAVGYVITSRGCPGKRDHADNPRCWYCSVRRRDGDVRELPITEGWNVLDDNILACSPAHIRGVLEMLRRQTRPIEFTGGLDAARFERWHADALRSIKAKQLFFAYDAPEDFEPLVNAASECWQAGFTKASHAVRAYVLCGWPTDSLEAAEGRMLRVARLGIIPMAMCWRGNDGKRSPAWRTFQRYWARPASAVPRAAQG